MTTRNLMGKVMSRMTDKEFMNYVMDKKRQGIGESQIARSLGMSLTRLMNRINKITAIEKKRSNIAEVSQLKENGYSNASISNSNIDVEPYEPLKKEPIKVEKKAKEEKVLEPEPEVEVEVTDDKSVDI